MLRNLIFKSFSYRPLSGAISTIEILPFKTIFKMRWRSSFKYLAVEDVADNTTELGIESEMEPEMVSLSNSSILLLIREKTCDIGVTEGATKGMIET